MTGHAAAGTAQRSQRAAAWAPGCTLGHGRPAASPLDVTCWALKLPVANGSRATQHMHQSMCACTALQRVTARAFYLYAHLTRTSGTVSQYAQSDNKPERPLCLQKLQSSCIWYSRCQTQVVPPVFPQSLMRRWAARDCARQKYGLPCHGLHGCNQRGLLDQGAAWRSDLPAST